MILWLAVALSAPVVPSGDTTPWDATLVAPSVSIDSKADVPTTLLRLGANVRVLEEIGAADRSDVLRHLQADPRWRVARWEGALVAVRRVEDGGDWVVRRDGYHVDGKRTWRTLLRFGPWSDASDWLESPLIAYWDPAKFELELAAWTMAEGPWDGQLASAVVVEGTAVRLDAHEVAKGRSRPQTRAAAEKVPPYLRSILEKRSEIRQSGYAAFFLPDKPATGKDRLDLAAPADGELEVKAWVNPGAAGWTWVRLLTEGGTAWEEEGVAVATAERVGWSGDGDAKFYLQARFPVPSGPREKITAEVWFQPDEGEARSLAAFDVALPKR